jgi:predicted nucleotidyltransferase
VDKRSIEDVIRALNEAGVRYLVVGGLAVIAHGYLRLTMDMDLFLDLQEDNLRGAVAALGRLGYRPQVPVPIEQFADANERARWISEKGMMVFSLHNPTRAATIVDLFVEEPIEFDKAYAKACRMEVASGLTATFVSVDDLITMKNKAGRPKDLDDVARLKELSEL